MESREMTYTAAQHEREMTRIEIQCKRRFAVILFVLCLLFMTIAGWIVYDLFIR